MDIVEYMRARVKVNEQTGCWEWQKARDRGGYGVMHLMPLYGRQMKKCHRVMWEGVHGSIPDGLCVLHHCDNPPCCNPEYLFIGTHADNAHDRDQKGRSQKGSRHFRAAFVEADIVEISKRIRAGETRLSIAASYGVSDVEIGMIATGEIWKHVEREIFPAVHVGRKVMTREQAVEVKRLLALGFNSPEVARQVEVGVHAVRQIASGQNWKHV